MWIYECYNTSCIKTGRVSVYAGRGKEFDTHAQTQYTDFVLNAPEINIISEFYHIFKISA